MITSRKLEKFKNIKHGFFDRTGGKSSGIYKSLNCGFGSSDKKKNILKNIKIICKKIGCHRNKLVLLHQIHSSKIFFIKNNYNFKKKIKSDASITQTKNVALGILTADCVPVLIYDKKLKIISAVHAGWKGAYKGIVTKVINFFLKKGSSLKNLYAIVGPSITGKNYEVKKKFKQKFIKKDKKSLKYFKIDNSKLYFDLSQYVYSQILQNKIKNIDMIKLDTFDIKNKFFSARRALSLKQNDYGRNISIIMLN